MPELVLSLLGTPEVLHDGRPVTFSTRKTLALLTFLAVDGGMHSRKELAALLWPESDSPRSRRSLRRALASLRQVLGDAHTADAPYISVETDTLSFNTTSSYKMDVQLLEQASQTLSENTGVSDALSESDWKAAIDLYRGDFLAGFFIREAPAFEDWVSMQRQINFRRMETVIDRLSEYLHKRGDLPAAIQTGLRWIAHSSLNEGAHHRLMQLYFTSGDRGAALEAYETWQELARSELGVEPSPETQQLARRIQTEPPPSLRPASELGWAAPKPNGALVGREGEHHKLVELYRLAERGHAQAAVIEGESGIGKTRLAREFTQWAVANGALVLSAQAFEAGGGLPYRPFLDALRAQLAREDLDQLLSPRWLSELSRLFPNLRDRYAELPPPLPEQATAKTRLFEALAQLGEALAGESPLVVFIDDIHWADRASLDLILYTATRWVKGETRALLLLSARSEALARRPDLEEWMLGLEKGIPTARNRLGPITREDTHQLVASLVGETGSKDDAGQQPDLSSFSEWLFEETRGQPLYISAVIDSLLERGTLKKQVSRAGAPVIEFEESLPKLMSLTGFLPRGIREVIQARLKQLKPPSSDLLVAAAVLEHGISFQLMREIADQQEDAALSAVEELIAGGLLRERTVGRGDSIVHTYDFDHHKIRDVVYAEAGEARRSIYHRRALEALEAVPAAPAELARHSRAAGLNEQAFHYSVLAGDEAMGLFAASDAVTHYSQAIRLGDSTQAENLPADLLVHLFSNRGRALELINRPEEAFANYEQMEAIAKQRDDPRIELESLVARATLCSIPGPLLNFEQGSDLSQRAIGLAQETGDRRLEAKSYWNLLLLNMFFDRPGDAIAYGDQSIAIARELDFGEQLAYSLNDISRAHAAIGQVDKGKIALDEARGLWRELGNLPMLADNLVNSAHFLYIGGEHRRAIALLEEAHRINAAQENDWGLAFGGSVEGIVHLELGEMGQAIDAFEDAIRAAERFGMPTVRACVRAELAWLYASLGTADLAHPQADEARQALKSLSLPPQFQSWALGALARTEILLGGLEQAAIDLQKSQKGLNAEDYSSARIRVVQLAAAELALASEDAEGALKLMDELVTQFRRLGVRAMLPEALLLMGRALMLLGHADEARRCLFEAFKEAESLGARYVLLQVVLALAEIDGPAESQAEHRVLAKRASSIALQIAEGIRAADVRAAFLSSPSVHVTLEGE